MPDARTTGDQALWTTIDQYFSDRIAPQDAALDAALAASDAAGLPSIQVSQNQGKFLHILIKAIGAKRVLEVGTLGGYSTIWLARALPADGRLVTLEVDPHHAAVAQANIARAGVRPLVDLRVGKAIDALPELAQAGEIFDFIFIDADKPGTADYFTWSLKLARPGTLIVVDNVVRHGEIVDAASTDPSVQGMRRFTDLIAKEPRVIASTIQTVGTKGYDGFMALLVTSS